MTRGYYGGLHRLRRSMKDAVMRAGKHAYTGRKDKKGQMRSLWIVRVNAALIGTGLNYNRFINALKKAQVAINRKMLAEIAATDAKAFARIVETARSNGS